MSLSLGLVLSALNALPEGPTLPFTNLSLDPGNVDTQTSIYRVFRTADEFLSGWSRSDNCDDACARSIIASVDFARNMVVLVAPRGRGQNTYDVVVSSVTASQDTIDVSFIELRHGPSVGEVLCGVLLIMPTPVVAIVIPHSPLPVRFFRERADVVCEYPVEVTNENAPSN